MIDRTGPATDPKRKSLILKTTLAALLATTALGVVSAHAVDGTWIGGGDEWTDPARWSSNQVPDGTATFTISEPTAVQSNGIVTIGSVLFTAAPNAQAYTITTNDQFLVNGAGVFNNSTNNQTFNPTAITIFQNSSTASGGTKAVTYVNTGTVLFQNSSTAGTATLTNNSTLEFDNTSTAGTAKITNNVVADFFNSSSAGTAQITNTAAATLSFHDTSSAGASTITNSGAVVFLDSSSAGSASISTTSGSFATITFNNTSTAGNANIALVDGTLTFNNSSTAANATIVNNSGGTTTFGALGGTDTSNAGTSHITNNNTGITNFLANTSAMNATIANNSGGKTNFQDQSTAGNATIVNNSGGTTTFGVPLVGTDTASAGSAVIINNSGGTTAFFAATTAGNATIINSAGANVQFGDFGGTNDTASGGNSTIDNSWVVSFNSKTTAGTATITTHSNGIVFFFNNSSGGGARFITDAGGTVDISALASAGTTAGSIEGAGVYFIGAKNFAVGSNNLSTTVSGLIVGNGGGGSLTKVGTGTLILSGTNTYTGGTTISAGTLQLGNGGTTGSIVGNIVDNGTLAINHSNAFVYGGVISGSGAFRQIGSGTTTLTNANTYTGPTTVTAGTLAISATGSITSNVTNNATFTNAGTVTGSLTNTGTASNTGVWSGNVQSNTGTINNSLTWTGAVSNTAGTFNNNAAGTVSGLVTNAGATNNSGALNGGLSNTAGTTTNTGTINGGANITGGTFNNTAPGTVSGLVTNAGATNNSGTLNGGLSNTAGTTTNTGTINGGATVSGGTLNTSATTSIVNGGLTNSATVNARNQVNGAIVNQGAGTFNVAGNLAGNNSFTNNGTAQLLVNGGNFTGITTLTNNSTNATGINVSATRTLSTTGTVTNAAGANIAVSGTLTAGQLLTNAGVVLVNSGGTLNATVGGITNAATGTITVALGGTVNDDLDNAGVVTNNGAYNAIVATNTGAITNSPTGVWTGNVLSNAAAITNSGVWTGNVVSNVGTIDNNKTWTGTVSNAGTFNNNAGATVSGLLTNTAGTTTNNGALNGGALVSGGTFTGAGTVTNLTVSGGTFAPGNGTPGTSMTVTGNLAFQSGAMYLVTLNPTTASFTSVGGTASLNGTAAAVYLAGNYVAKNYTILTAAGGVSGTFGSLANTNVPTNFGSSLSYDANNAYLNLTLIFNPAILGNLNVNQQNVANALTGFFNRTGGIPAVFGSLNAAGLTIASGELGTGVIQSSIKANDLFLNLLLDPTVAGRAGGFTAVGSPSRFAEEDEALAYAAKRRASPSERDAYAMARKAPSLLAPQTTDRWSVWGAAYGGSGTTDGNAVVGSQDTTARAYGVAVGADYRITPNTLLGFALAGGGTSFSLANGLGSGSADLFQAGAFARHNLGAAYLSGALAYGWHDVTTNRTVAMVGDQLRARFQAETFSGRVEGGYRFATPLIGITPYAAAQVISFNLPAYAEQALAGGGLFALNYASQTTTATRTELGLRSDKSFAVQDAMLTLRGRAAWAHDYNTDRSVTAVFQALPGANFVVNGARGRPDGALVSAGAEMKWTNGFSLAATFEGEFSGNTNSYSGKGVARYAW